MKAHLDSAERQKRAEEDLNTLIQKQSARLQEEQRRSVCCAGCQTLGETCATSFK